MVHLWMFSGRLFVMNYVTSPYWNTEQKTTLLEIHFECKIHLEWGELISPENLNDSMWIVQYSNCISLSL